MKADSWFSLRLFYLNFSEYGLNEAEKSNVACRTLMLHPVSVLQTKEWCLGFEFHFCQFSDWRCQFCCVCLKHWPCMYRKKSNGRYKVMKAKSNKPTNKKTIADFSAVKYWEMKSSTEKHYWEAKVDVWRPSPYLLFVVSRRTALCHQIR